MKTWGEIRSIAMAAKAAFHNSGEAVSGPVAGAKMSLEHGSIRDRQSSLQGR
jgi:hypothetical protein